MTSLRFWAVVSLLGLASYVLHRRGDVDRQPPSTPLAQLPRTLDGMGSVEIPLEADTLEVLGKGVFLNRVYQPAAKAVSAPSQGADGGSPDSSSSAAAAAAPAVSLFIGYFPTQRTGQSIHSPQHCLPGAGWTFESSGVADIQGTRGEPEQVGDYLISNGPARAEVLYWYQSQGHTIASDYTAKLYMLADSIRYNRTDAALVRIVTPVLPSETRDAARRRALGFAQTLMPLLPAYIPN